MQTSWNDYCIRIRDPSLCTEGMAEVARPLVRKTKRHSLRKYPAADNPTTIREYGIPMNIPTIVRFRTGILSMTGQYKKTHQ
ncbi:hypothetical protein E2C01_019177 [Portunus trituberculatus]|uniref:Uncharacterized protein n=1 Tax=Portunus trituberculatus TaxID=210409 RepID=A0A5B7DYB9_PORTR|nr:hypothetical protein [Portunus trituberculatus]